MRYYGISSGNSSYPQQTRENRDSDYMSDTERQILTEFEERPPQIPNNQPVQEERPPQIPDNQPAQNVHRSQNQIENPIPATFPPGSNPSSMGIPNAVVYDYPAENEFSSNMPESCPYEDASNSFLCRHRGQFIRVEFMNQTEKSGILRSVGSDYIVLAESRTNNLVMCALSSVKAINVHNSSE